MNGMTIILVAAGGAAGALLRFGIASLLAPASESKGFPLGTLAANLLGCLAIGLLFGVLQRVGDDANAEKWNAFLIAGLLGAMTTFSTFIMDILKAHSAKGALVAAAYLGMSVVLGVLLAALGVKLSGGSLGA